VENDETNLINALRSSIKVSC